MMPRLISQTATVFHGLLALHLSLRNGHSCLPVNHIANQLLGFASDSNGVISHQGYLLPNEQVLTSLFSALAIAPAHKSGNSL